jgi:peptidoglycan biosynthesis protein MviN/MurJ (putative lipid II flippase)
MGGSNVTLTRLWRSRYSPSLLFSGANTLCGVVFQLGALYKLGVGARSDLYYASIIIPTVLYSLAFGALNNVLVPMFVEAKASAGGEQDALLWNCLFLTLGGGLVLLAVLYYPVLFGFPLLFRKLAWVDMAQVGKVLLAYSLYQILYTAVLTKNCSLFARGRPVAAQAGVFCGWVVSLSFLAGFHGSENLSRIPLCLVAGSTVALFFPNLGSEVFHYRAGLLRQHAVSMFSRTLPIAAGTSVGWLEPAIDGVIASTLKQGSLTIYYFFGRVMFYIATAIFSGYIQPATKHLAEAAGAGRWVELRRRTNSMAFNAVAVGLVISICALGVFLYLGIPKISFLRPYVVTFGQNLPVFLLLLGYLVGSLVYSVYSSSLYVMRRERLFLLASAITFPVGIFLKVLGARMLGLRGLAAGTSIYWVIWAAALAVCFSRAVGRSEKNAHSRVSSPSFQEQAVELLK